MKKIKPYASTPRPGRKLTTDETDKLVTKASALYAAAFPDLIEAGAEHSSCLYWAACAIHVAYRAGIMLVPQAGSAHFQRIRASMDDGYAKTHFSYVWSEPTKDELQALLAAGILPEIHVWAGDPARQHVVDLTTAHVPMCCEEMTGMDWLEVTPPRYLWGNELPEGWGYEAHREATVFAARIMERAALPKIIEAEKSGRVIDLDAFPTINTRSKS